MAEAVSDAKGRTVAVTVAGNPSYYVDWGPIAAGAFLATAISFLLLTFGSAIGLTLVSPYRNEGIPIVAFAVIAALWMVWVQVSSFMAGGYLAGRLRRRLGEGTPHEAEMRDGAHGLIVWAVGIVLGGLLISAAATGIAKGTAESAARGATAGLQSTDASQASEYTLDRLFRGDRAPADSAAARAEAARILAAGLVRDLRPDEKSYLAQTVAARTGLSQPEAEDRLNTLIAEAKKAADRTRKIGVLLAFLTAASLLVGAVGAWWAATVGGRHRDEGTDFSRLVRWR
jgi:hypothetical protein